MQPEQNPAPQPQHTPETPQAAPTQPVVPEQPSPNQPVQTPPQKKKLPTWAKILLIAFGSVVALIGIIILGLIIFANSIAAPPIKVSDEFIDAMQDNNASTAYNLTSSEFKAVTTEERLSALFDQISPRLQGDEEIYDKRVQIDNGVSTATIIYKVPSDDGGYYIRVVLREKNDKWEVLSMFTSKKELKANSN